MNDTERKRIKPQLLKCAKENENKGTFTGYVIVSSICRAAVERIEELETENNKLLDVINNQDVKIADLENFINAPLTKGRKTTRKELYQTVWDLSKQLTRAKEFLNEFVQHYKNKTIYVENMQDLLEQSEQFLKGENIILEDAQAGNSPFDADEVFNKEMKAYPEEK